MRNLNSGVVEFYRGLVDSGSEGFGVRDRSDPASREEREAEQTSVQRGSTLLAASSFAFNILCVGEV